MNFNAVLWHKSLEPDKFILVIFIVFESAWNKGSCSQLIKRNFMSSSNISIGISMLIFKIILLHVRIKERREVNVKLLVYDIRGRLNFICCNVFVLNRLPIHYQNKIRLSYVLFDLIKFVIIRWLGLVYYSASTRFTFGWRTRCKLKI